MPLEFTLRHEADGVQLYEARTASGQVVRLDVFGDYVQVQLGSGFVKRVPSEAKGRAYAEVEWAAGSL